MALIEHELRRDADSLESDVVMKQKTLIKKAIIVPRSGAGAQHGRRLPARRDGPFGREQVPPERAIMSAVRVHRTHPPEPSTHGCAARAPSSPRTESALVPEVSGRVDLGVAELVRVRWLLRRAGESLLQASSRRRLRDSPSLAPKASLARAQSEARLREGQNSERQQGLLAKRNVSSPAELSAARRAEQRVANANLDRRAR